LNTELSDSEYIISLLKYKLVTWINIVGF